MQIFINALDGAVHRFEVVPETTVANLKVRSYGTTVLFVGAR